MSEFTQGEWELHTNLVRVNCAVACVVEIPDDPPYTIAIIPKRAGKTQSECMANGRLIEAAPEMYGLLYEAMQELKGYKPIENGISTIWPDIEELLARIDGKKSGHE